MEPEVGITLSKIKASKNPRALIVRLELLADEYARSERHAAKAKAIRTAIALYEEQVG